MIFSVKFAATSWAARSALPFRALGQGGIQASSYSQRAKTNSLKTKEKAKLRRQRVNKTDEPAQAKRNPRVSKL
ncbi:hypothetical protein GGF42_009173 [Coemansia sp. RSA 2424]|nr:hypothetical protein GGF42_009173 [Coemansia sp. RSA 2424]